MKQILSFKGMKKKLAKFNTIGELQLQVKFLSNDSHFVL